MISYIS